MSLKGIKADENQLEWLRSATKHDFFDPISDEVIDYRDTVRNLVGNNVSEFIEDTLVLGDPEEVLYAIHYKLTSGLVVSVAMHWFSERTKAFEIALINKSSDEEGHVQVLCFMDDDPVKAATLVEYYIEVFATHRRPYCYDDDLLATPQKG